MVTYIEDTGAIYTEEQRSSICLQLDRLLANSHFSHSKRFPSFLRFIIQEELGGRGDLLKERTIGVEVFGRSAQYDTTADPIVRVTAAEIRKRIAQYYQETGHVDELRISLPAGSYVPHFAWPRVEPADSLNGATPQPIDGAATFDPSHEAAAAALDSLSPGNSSLNNAPEAGQNAGSGRPGSLWPTGLGAGLLIVLLLAGWFWTKSRPSILDRFWAPVLDSNDPVVVCFPHSQVDTITLRSAASPEEAHHLQEQTAAMLIDDLQPLVSISGMLEMRHQRYILKDGDTATLTDLRRGPTVFVGAFDNAWTLRVTRGLRYRFGNDPDMKHFWIEDTQSPRVHWQIDRSQQLATNNYRDYAIVARFVDSSTGHVAVVAAGIARGGTVAAGEFLTQPGNMEAIKTRAPKDWDGKNMEFVLSTEIIDGRSAPPRVEATYFW